MNTGDVIGEDRGEDVIDTGRCPTATCGLHVYVPRSQYELLTETGLSFFCAAGHSQSFTARPVINERKKKLQEAERAAERARAAAEQAERRADLAARTCPWPTCDGKVLASPRGLRQHMVKTHGAPWAMPELGIEEVGQVLNGRDPSSLVDS